ncbi:Lecithin retinol acyltransferase domain-containing protein [Phytophthora infestans]|uniref:Lecithin retinol acyltransferase domain-containing protein n=1 Tax=Phytophthora infestans TaxID=4787 RepID=A0A833SZS0_PHYIN|nr:Lecithin retinol acyltransferase domain-containing protein [Phytophthora infestans]
MNTCEVQDVAKLRAADHICIWDTSRWPFRYTHHGVVFTAGESTDEISIAHVWSRKTGLRASQADSKFQLTSLTEFLNGRPLPDMRRVQYNSSLVAEASSLLGEVHRTHADAPPVVLARCRFLLGLGQGHFSILSLNCEHVALWCTTGVGWSKQLLSRTETKVPFLTSSAKSAQALERLQFHLLGIQEMAKQRNKKLEDLAGKKVYLRLKDTGKFAKRFGDELYLVQDDPSEKDWAFRQRPTALRLGARVQAYNCVRVEFEDYEKPGDVLYASSSGLRLTRRRKMQFKRWFQFELGWDGELQSLRHRRWFVGAQTRDGLLRPFISRDKAATFEIVDADEMDAKSPVNEPSSSDSEDNSFPTAPIIKRAESAPELEMLSEDGDAR